MGVRGWKEGVGGEGQQVPAGTALSLFPRAKGEADLRRGRHHHSGQFPPSSAPALSAESPALSLPR